MVGFFRYTRRLPALSDFSLNSYQVDFSLDRLLMGVDNIRHDVFLSPTFVTATRKIVARLITRYAGVHNEEGERRKHVNWGKEVDSYQQLYLEVMRDGLNKAKGRGEVQIRYLAHIAAFKMLLEEIKNQYELLVGRLKKAVRKSELVSHDDIAEIPRLQGKLQETLQIGEDLKKRVGLEICDYWAKVGEKSLYTMHEAVFGRPTPFFKDMLINPLFHVENPENEFFLIAEYDIILGRRIEDPDKYGALLFFIKRLFNYIDTLESMDENLSVDQRLVVPTLADEKHFISEQEAYNKKIAGWIQYPGNIDTLFNWRQTRSDLQTLKKQGADRSELETQKLVIQQQKEMLDFFFTQFRKNNLIDRIVASYEMQPEYINYCPPLAPQQIAQYLLAPKSRKVVRSRLKRMKEIYGRDFSLRPINKKIKAIEQITTARRKAHLVRFLKAFLRYHRDKCNYELISDAMARINLATDEKIQMLSRENNTLYEFLLPHEQTAEKAPIINHVVIKADVRGSTDITHQMNERGLNPASYFSLNFFDPIAEILSDFDAAKVFIEGDAIILSIFEHANTPGDWFSVARACGIALNMLLIIQRYNTKSRKTRLPVLEIGIGISYLAKSPTFLFDGGNRIMISPAINQADRLSGCSKTGRRLYAKKKRSFNLYVFQTLADEEIDVTSDDLMERYNVNGIELSPDAFTKLSGEIDLKPLEGPRIEKLIPKYKLYTGKFPTKSGRYQRLVIREANIQVVNPETLRTIRTSELKYYEVCTNPVVYKLARQMHD